MPARFKPPPPAPLRAVAQPRITSHGPAPGHAPPLPATAAPRHFAPPPAAGAGGGTIRTGIVQGLFRTLPRPSDPGVAQARPAGGGASHGAIPLPATLRLPAGGGAPLPDGLRAQMETFFKADFSSVRVHVGPEAPAVGALAFTTGSRIFFAPGQYQPATVQGRVLLGHELAHVVQQRCGRVRNPQGGGIAIVRDHALEAEADRLGRQAAMACPPGPAAGGAAQARTTPGRLPPQSGGIVQRMQHNGPPYAPTKNEAQVYYEVREMRTQKGNPLTANKMRGNLFEAVSKEELEAIGLFKAVYDANLVVPNCPGIDYICVMHDDDIIFAQCKNHPDAQSYVPDLKNRSADARLFVLKMVTRTMQGQLSTTAQRMRQFATINNVVPIKNLLASIDKYYGFDPDKTYGSTPFVDENDPPVEYVANKIFFPIPGDIYFQIPKTYINFCLLMERETDDFGRMLGLMTYKQTRTSSQKRMDEEMEEYRPSDDF